MSTFGELLSILGASSALVVLAASSTSNFSALNFLTPAATYCTARFGSGLRSFALQRLLALNIDTVRKSHWDINTWDDSEVLTWKNSAVSNAGAISVAGAIFASIGLSALQLPNIVNTHWTARAFLSASMVLGIFSVIYATSQQQLMGSMNKPQDIRLWLSRGKVDLEKRPYRPPYNLLPLESSVSAQMIVDFPGVLLEYSVLLYFAGFGLYLLFSWLNAVDSDVTGLRNVFIVFCIVCGAVCAYQFLLAAVNLLDVQKRTHDFDLDHQEDFVKPDSRQQLEVWLKALRDMRALTSEDQADYAALENKINEVLRKWKLQKMEAAEAAEVEKKMQAKGVRKGYRYGHSNSDPI